VSERIDLHRVLHDLLPEVRALVGDRIAVSWELALVGGEIAVSATELCSAVLALVRNAAAAMPAGGALTIRTEHVEAAGAELGPVPPLAPGRYMRVTVQDTGRGMDEAERVHAIESAEQQTRGLALVLQLVRRARGALWLDSATSLGTRAFLYFPMEPATAGRRAAVLLVEDESAVRSVVRRMLIAQGFAVREARDGESALRIWHAERPHIVAVVSDVVMPVMGGRELARELRRSDPAMPVLFISAYTGDVPDLLDGVEAPREVLGKPFTNEALLTALRGLLAGRS
jgi:CheY-like chemotaxis protein